MQPMIERCLTKSNKPVCSTTSGYEPSPSPIRHAKPNPNIHTSLATSHLNVQLISHHESSSSRIIHHFKAGKFKVGLCNLISNFFPDDSTPQQTSNLESDLFSFTTPPTYQRFSNLHITTHKHITQHVVKERVRNKPLYPQCHTAQERRNGRSG